MRYMDKKTEDAAGGFTSKSSPFLEDLHDENVLLWDYLSGQQSDQTFKLVIYIDMLGGEDESSSKIMKLIPFGRLRLQG